MCAHLYGDPPQRSAVCPLRILGQTAGNTFLQFSLLSSSFPSLTHCDLSSVTATGHSSYSTFSKADLPLTTFTLHLPIMKVFLVCCRTWLCRCHSPHSTASSKVHSTHFQVPRQTDLSTVLVCSAEALYFAYGYPISCNSKWRKKRNHSNGHDADITPVSFHIGQYFLLFSYDILLTNIYKTNLNLKRSFFYSYVGISPVFRQPSTEHLYCDKHYASGMKVHNQGVSGLKELTV